jgi:GAF domain-containing protein
VDGSIAGAALAADTAILVADPPTDTRTYSHQAEPSGTIGPTLAVPIPGNGGPAGVLAVSRSPADEPFDDRDQHMIAAFASRAGLALTLATSRRQSEELHLIEDRGYIAEQLREGVISRLFAAGLAVQAVLPRVGNTSAKESLNRHIDEIDGIISDIRKAVFSLRELPPNGP